MDANLAANVQKDERREFSEMCIQCYVVRSNRVCPFNLCRKCCMVTPQPCKLHFRMTQRIEANGGHTAHDGASSPAPATALRTSSPPSATAAALQTPIKSADFLPLVPAPPVGAPRTHSMMEAASPAAPSASSVAAAAAASMTAAALSSLNRPNVPATPLTPATSSNLHKLPGALLVHSHAVTPTSSSLTSVFGSAAASNAMPSLSKLFASYGASTSSWTTPAALTIGAPMQVVSCPFCAQYVRCDDALYRSHLEQCNPWLPQQHSGVLRLPWRALHDLCLRVAHPDQPNPDSTPIDVPLDLPVLSKELAHLPHFNFTRIDRVPRVSATKLRVSRASHRSLASAATISAKASTKALHTVAAVASTPSPAPASSPAPSSSSSSSLLTLASPSPVPSSSSSSSSSSLASVLTAPSAFSMTSSLPASIAASASAPELQQAQREALTRLQNIDKTASSLLDGSSSSASTSSIAEAAAVAAAIPSQQTEALTLLTLSPLTEQGLTAAIASTQQEIDAMHQ